jgi:hypothetical protein
MEIILILFLLFVFLPMMGGWLFRAYLKRRFKRFRQEAGYTEETGGEAPKNSKKRKKVFTQEEGEYVDFEEIKSPKPPKKTPSA